MLGLLVQVLLFHYIESFAGEIIWTIALIIKNKTGGDFVDTKTPLLKNYLFYALAGTTWFLQFFFYGMGETKIGNGASSWILPATDSGNIKGKSHEAGSYNNRNAGPGHRTRYGV